MSLVTFPENPEQNDQKIRESKERGISSTFLVPDFPGWVSLLRVGNQTQIQRSRHPGIDGMTPLFTMKQQPGFVGRIRRGAAVTRRF